MKWEYLLVTLKSDTGGQAVVDTVNGQELARSHRLAHEYLNEMGQQGWVAFTSFGLTPERPTFALRRQAQLQYTERATPPTHVTPPMFTRD
jgi:hypothetical protein